MNRKKVIENILFIIIVLIICACLYFCSNMLKPWIDNTGYFCSSTAMNAFVK